MLLVITLIPLTHILITANPGCEFRTGEKINHLLFIYYLKLYSKSENALNSPIRTSRIFSEDIGIQFGIKKCAMLNADGIKLTNDKVIKSLEE